jgi:hypothetical protein
MGNGARFRAEDGFCLRILSLLSLLSVMVLGAKAQTLTITHATVIDTVTGIELRRTHAEGPISVLPLKCEATLMHEPGGVCFEGVDRGCQRYCCWQQKEEMTVVRHSSRSEKRDFLLARNRCNKRIDSFLEFRWDQIFSVFGAVDRVDIIIGIGMAHVPRRFRGG